MQEWNHNKRWNPFNSYKLLAHVEKWKRINRGCTLPAPILVTVDPTNKCNLNCRWCNAKYIRDKNKNELSATAMMKIADFLPYWSENDGVKSVCIAGGGEPLMNPYVGQFIDRLVMNNIEVGVVTNGLLMHQFLGPL
ncbi:MAG TPA: radical SAM protein, partial [Patescibacteria group bacterium]|nr:radical SAM protein [Patescibacteria group bacterium]